MAQTQSPAYVFQDLGDFIDYTPGSAKYGGDIVLVGTVPCLVTKDIAANAKGSVKTDGVWKIPKVTGAITAGDAVYWDVDGSPVTGTASTGAAAGTASLGELIGMATADAASGDDYVYVKANGMKRTATIAGSVTADDITGSDSSLGISGQAANAGGAIVITGGAGALTGGGAVSAIGGAASGNNAAGGAVNIDGGAGHGTGAAGAVTIGTNAASITLGKMPRFPVALINAAGGNIATATAVTAGLTVVAGADNSTGVQLPSCVNGAVCVLVNQTTDKTLKVYPPTGKEINGAGANNAIVMAANTIDFLFSEGTNSWRGFTAAIDLS